MGQGFSRCSKAVVSAADGGLSKARVGAVAGLGGFSRAVVSAADSGFSKAGVRGSGSQAWAQQTVG